MASQAGGGQFGGGSGQGAGATSAWSRMANNSLNLLDPQRPAPLLLPAPAQTPASAPTAKPVPVPASCPVPPPAPLKTVQSCPLRQQSSGVAGLLAPPKPQSLEPCDLNAMTISLPPPDETLWARFTSQNWLGKLIKEKPASGFQTITLAPLDGMPVPPARISGRVKLRTVDLQLVAPVEGSRKGEPKKIKVKLEPGPGFCGAKSHPDLSIEPVPKGLSSPMHGRTSCEFSVLAAPITDPVISSKLTPLAFLAALIRKTDLSRTYTISSDSCGNRNSSQAVSGMSCKIKVLPEKLLIVKLSFPESISGSLSVSKTTTTNKNAGAQTRTVEKKIEGEFTNQYAGRDARGVALDGGKASLSDKQITVTDKSGMVTQVSQQEAKIGRTIDRKGAGTFDTTHTYGSVDMLDPASGASSGSLYKNVKSDDGLGYVAGIGVSVEHDGVELGASFKDFVEWISMAKSVIDGADKLGNWLNRSVQIGWKVTGSVKALSGEVKVVWGIKQLPDEALVGRYFGAELEITIIDAALEVSFGLCVAFPGLADDEDLLSARIIGTLSGSVKLKGSYEELTNSPVVGRTATVTGAVTLKLEGNIVAAKIIHISADVSGGVQAVGKWDGSIGQPPESNISVGLTPVEANASVKVFFWTRKYGPATLIGETEPFYEVKL
ncbi:MAG: hypothetical protein ACOVQ0_00380 [Novosphingobium sp.]|uniref:hypothetical protein n=1 Tax=Novosphingobium sp. TaxID=1874826 RepID=UPI003B9D2AB6